VPSSRVESASAEHQTHYIWCGLSQNFKTLWASAFTFTENPTSIKINPPST